MTTQNPLILIRQAFEYICRTRGVGARNGKNGVTFPDGHTRCFHSYIRYVEHQVKSKEKILTYKQWEETWREPEAIKAAMKFMSGNQ